MKICWDNINNIRLDKKGNFRDVLKCKTFYTIKCKQCGEEFLGSKNGKFCTNECSREYNINQRRKKLGNTNERKKCPGCNRILPFDDFGYSESRKYNLSAYCKECEHDKYIEKSDPKNGRRLGIVDNKKKCSCCKQWLNITNFNKNTLRGDGLQSICKQCQTVKQIEYRKTEKGKERDLRYRKSEKGTKCYRKASKKYRQTEKYKNNKLYRNISGMIRYSLNESNKDGKWTELVDWNLQELKERIETQFKEGMSWDNHGEWHIDHIRPIASFNITDYSCDDFRECWSLNNLQPLWASDNQSKGAKWNGIDWRYN